MSESSPPPLGASGEIPELSKSRSKEPGISPESESCEAKGSRSPKLDTNHNGVIGVDKVHTNTTSVLEAFGSRLIPSNYLEQGLQACATRDKRIRILLEQRKWPKVGWDDLSIEMFIQHLASMDSNNFITKIGVGEREARIYSSLVNRRHYGLCHGIGRSGDLGEAQPKAIGSSLMSSLVNALVLDVCKTLVSPKVSAAFLSPMATGMSLTLVLLTMKREKPKAKFVVWSRIDQKSCFKCIVTAGLQPLVIEGDRSTGEVRTNIEEMKSVVKVYGAAKILCFLTTTSCFAPRVPDSLDAVSKLCRDENIFHVVNNAYGLQNSGCAHQILEGSKVGRLDVFVQSTDKNLMVPVGGAIIAGFNKDLIQKIRQTYPGRASSSQSLDVLITLLSMGSTTYTHLVQQTKENYAYLRGSMEELASGLQESVIPTPHNRISIAMSLERIGPKLEPAARSKVITQLGSMLFRRHVGGCRVVTGLEVKNVEGHEFRGWGAHHDTYPTPYLTAAATIGMDRKDIDEFIKKLEECYRKLSATFEQSKTLDHKLEELEVNE